MAWHPYRDGTHLHLADLHFMTGAHAPQKPRAFVGAMGVRALVTKGRSINTPSGKTNFSSEIDSNFFPWSCRFGFREIDARIDP